MWNKRDKTQWESLQFVMFEGPWMHGAHPGLLSHRYGKSFPGWTWTSPGCLNMSSICLESIHTLTYSCLLDRISREACWHRVWTEIFLPWETCHVKMPFSESVLAPSSKSAGNLLTNFLCKFFCQLLVAAGREFAKNIILKKSKFSDISSSCFGSFWEERQRFEFVSC